jgi:hypothetical protein
VAGFVEGKHVGGDGLREMGRGGRKGGEKGCVSVTEKMETEHAVKKQGGTN